MGLWDTEKNFIFSCNVNVSPLAAIHNFNVAVFSRFLDRFTVYDYA